MADALTLWLLAQAQAGKLEPTIAGGPPSFTGVLGQQVFDTKYGLTWWWDGSAWHANGPGLIASIVYLAGNTGTVGAGSWTNISGYADLSDPLAMFTYANPGYFTLPLTGRYRATFFLQAGATFADGAQFLGSIVVNAPTPGAELCRINATEGGSVGGPAGTVTIDAYLAAGTKLYTAVVFGTASVVLGGTFASSTPPPTTFSLTFISS